MKRWPWRVLLAVFLLIGTGIGCAEQPALAAGTTLTVEDCVKNPSNPDCQRSVSGKAPAVDGAGAVGVGFSAWDFIRLLFGLTFVIAVLYAVLRFLNRRNQMIQRSQIIQNLGGIGIGPQRSVQALKVGNRILLVGVGETVTLLKELDDLAEVEDLLARGETAEPALDTSLYIAKLFHRKTSASGRAAGASPPPKEPFADLLSSRLADLKNTREKALGDWKEKERTPDE